MRDFVTESKDILSERKKYSILESTGGEHPLTKECWGKLSKVMSDSVETCMTIIDSANKEELEFITEVLDDVTDVLISDKYIKELENRKSKFDKIGCSIDTDIAYAKELLS